MLFCVDCAPIHVHGSLGQLERSAVQYVQTKEAPAGHTGRDVLEGALIHIDAVVNLSEFILMGL